MEPRKENTSKRLRDRDGIIKALEKQQNEVKGKRKKQWITQILANMKSQQPGKVDVRSSKLRHMRNMQRDKKFTKNIGQTKYKDGKGTVIYVLAPSMGLGVKQVTSVKGVDEKEKTKRCRSHSEALLTGVKQAGALTVGGKKVVLGEAKHHASTNAACKDKKGQQNCEGQVVPILTDKNAQPFHHAVPYEGSEDAGGWSKLVTAHDWCKKNVDEYDSETDSEDDEKAEVYVVNDEAVRGKDIGSTPMEAEEYYKG
jgi:hypothetical protein